MKGIDVTIIVNVNLEYKIKAKNINEGFEKVQKEVVLPSNTVPESMEIVKAIDNRTGKEYYR